MALAVAAALVPAMTYASDPQPYAVQLDRTGDGNLDDALQASSELESLRKAAPTNPFALIARARQDRERLATVAESFGYYAATIAITIEGRELEDAQLPQLLTDLASDHDAAVKVVVTRGPLYHVRSIRIDGEISETARATLGLSAGDAAVAQPVLDARTRLLARLQQEGHAFAEIDTPIADLDGSEPLLDLTFKVQPGPVVKLGEIRIAGLKRVHEAAVRHRINLRQGERYDAQRIDATRRELLGLGVFSGVSVQLPNAANADDSVPLAFQVAERPRRSVKLSVNYSSDLGGNAGATWSDHNVFGNAEQLNLSATATNFGGSATNALGYDTRAELIKPDFLRVDQSLRLSVEALKQSLTAYDQTSVLTGAMLTRKLSALWSASVGVTLQREKVTQAQVLNQPVTQDYTLLALPLRAVYDSTGQSNPLQDPLHGWRATVGVAPTESLTPPHATFVILQGGISTYIDLGHRDRQGRSILALRASAGNAYGAGPLSLPPDQRFYGGGSATVRGYRYQSVGPQFPDNIPMGGTALLAGTVELRQRVGRNFGIVAFADGGKVTATTQPVSGNFSVGVGTGVRYYTPIGPVRLDVAVPTHRPLGGDRFEIYIGLGQVF